MAKIDAEDGQQQFTAQWLAAPASARKCVWLSWLCGLLWAIRIVVISLAHGGVRMNASAFAVLVFGMFFFCGYAAMNRKRVQFALLTALTLFSFVGPVTFLVYLVLAGWDKGRNVAYFEQFFALSILELAAGLALLICLFLPTTLRRVWGKGNRGDSAG